jgi:outer membrane protein OmpA-like peptidoglycan-associated protein
MKKENTLKRVIRKAWPLYSKNLKGLILIILILISVQVTLHAQEAQYTRPSWRFGVAAGANLNYYQGTTQQLTLGYTIPKAFTEGGKGLGLYIAPVWEFHPATSMLGVMLQIGYDNRQGSLEQVITPCNCPTDLSTNLSYITIEPSLRFAPFKSDFYLFGGPRLAINFDKSFTYKQGTNPDYPDQVANPNVSENFSNMHKTLISMQIGAGYDIQLSSQKHQTQVVLSPFVSFQPYFGQNPRSIESWNMTTLRFGVALKFGRGILIPIKEDMVSLPVTVLLVDPEVKFSINSPANITEKRRVRETFPLRNYIFFDLGSTKIPERYVLLNRDQVKDFKENQLEVFTPKQLSGRSDREMTVYYNVLNILGDRMGKNPSSTIILVGSSDEGAQDGRKMAESVKKYLVDTFKIDASRISVEGREKPKLPSENSASTSDLDLRKEGDRRVSIESGSPALLMEFQSGQEAPLKPMEIVAVQEAPLDSYVSFYAEGQEEAFTSWSLEIRDEKGNLQNFGPYSKEKVSIPGKSILGNRAEGDYLVTMIGQTKSGKTVKKTAYVHMSLWTPPVDEQGMRFSIIYEFNDSKAIKIYEKYLTEIATPKIPKGATVLIHGYTDIIGDEASNIKLSLARANDVRAILAKSMANAGRTDVKLEAYGFSEDQNFAPFDNKFPEGRFYNRTVIIDIIPK